MTTDQASVLAGDNVDNTTARVISAGGKVMARSILRSARVIVAQDPTRRRIPGDPSLPVTGRKPVGDREETGRPVGDR